MGTLKKRRNARVDVDGEMNEEQPPEITPDMTAREAQEAYSKLLNWNNSRVSPSPPMPNVPIKGPGLRPNELFINTAYAMMSKKGKGQVSNMEQMILALRAKAASGQAGAAEMVMDMYFHSLKEGELQPVSPEIIWK